MMAEKKKLTEAEINELKAQAAEVIPERVSYFAGVVGVVWSDYDSVPEDAVGELLEQGQPQLQLPAHARTA